MTDEAKPQPNNAVIAELVAMDFGPAQPEMTFRVPADSRWSMGRYCITRLQEGKPHD